MDEDEWVGFADMLDPGDLPTFGFRVLVRIGSDGEMHLNYDRTGTKIHAYTMVGAVMGALFEEFHDHMHDSED